LLKLPSVSKPVQINNMRSPSLGEIFV